MVVTIKTEEEWNEIVKDNKHVLVDFFAQWCGPCKAIAPKFIDLSNAYPEIAFVKIDIEVDALKGLVDMFGISSLPTFILLEDAQVKGKQVGADITKIQALIDLAKA